MAGTRPALWTHAHAPQAASPSTVAAAVILGVQLDNERLMQLVQDMLHPKSLPRGWSANYDTSMQQWVFKDRSGVEHNKHPLHDYYTGAIFMDQGGWAAVKRSLAEQPPEQQQVQQMAAYLHIKPQENQYIWQVAEMALCAPLPPAWQQVQVKSATGLQMMFRKLPDGETQMDHPLDNYFRELIKRRRKALRQQRATEMVQEGSNALLDGGVSYDLEAICAMDNALPGSCDGSEYSFTPTPRHAHSRGSTPGNHLGSISGTLHAPSFLSKSGSGVHDAWGATAIDGRPGSTTNPGSPRRLLVRRVASLTTDYDLQGPWPDRVMSGACGSEFGVRHHHTTPLTMSGAEASCTVDDSIEFLKCESIEQELSQGENLPELQRG